MSVVAWDPNHVTTSVAANNSVTPTANVNRADENQARPATAAAQVVPGEILVVFEGDVVAAYQGKGAAAAMEAAGKLVGADGLDGPEVLMGLPAVAGRAARLVTHWNLPAGTDVLQTVQRLTGRPGIAYAEPNYLLSMDAMPTDSRFGELWGLNNTGQTVNGVSGTSDADIDAPEAWDITTGSSDVVVGVIDTGVDYSHPDLAANIWTNATELNGRPGVDDDGNGYVDDVHGYDFVNNDGNPSDDNGHGTHTSGTIGAGWNAEGVAGVNQHVQVMALKFLDSSGNGTTDNAVRAVDYATMMHDLYVSTGGTKGANIVLTSNSWGGGAYSQALYDAINSSGAANMLFVASAGNSGTNADVNPSYPAAYDLPNIISVAACDQNDAKASFSNWGATSVDLAAPGVNILSTTPGNAYGFNSGTSMAAPHVSGVAALAWGIAGNVSYGFIRDAIFQGVDPNPAFALGGATPVATGGRLNAYNTLTLVGMSVSGSRPGAHEIVISPTGPTSFVFDFSFPYNTDPSAGPVPDPSDLSVNGYTADSVDRTDADTLTFTFNSSPVTDEGVQTMTMAAGGIRAASGELPANADPALKAWTANFRWDATQLAVQSANPANGSTVTIPALGETINLAFRFNEFVDPTTVGKEDLLVSQGTVTDATLLADGVTVQFTVAGVVQEEVLRVTIPSGAIADTHCWPVDTIPGNPNVQYSGTYVLDWSTYNCPVPLEANTPLGSLIYDSTVSGFITDLDPGSAFSPDTDSFTITVDPDQTMTAVVDASATLRPKIEIRDGANNLLGDGSANAAGHDAVAQTVHTNYSSTATYTVSVSGLNDTTGAYTLRVILNAAVEDESHNGVANDGIGDGAQNIDAIANSSFISLTDGATRSAVMGTIEDTGYLGPDGSGYEAGAVTTSPPTFEDITTAGTRLIALDGADNASVVLKRGGKASGFQFNFYGTVYTESQIYASSNGLITFGSANTAAGNSDLSSSPEQAAIAVLWDDLVVDPAAPGAGVYWQMKGSGASQYLVVQWNNVRFIDASAADPITFQVILHENGELPDYIQFNYKDLSGGSSADEGRGATAGIKAPGVQGANRLLVSYNAGPGQCLGTGVSTRIAVGLAPEIETPDYYAFDLADGEKAMLVLKASGGNVALAVLDSAGTQVASATPGATNVDEAVEFVNLSTDGLADTYYAKVTGMTRAQYTLVVTRGAEFDLEPNAGPAPWAGDPAQTVELVNSKAVVLGTIGEDLVGYWPFDGMGADASGFGRTLDLAGGVGFAPGLFGQALDLHNNGNQFAARPVDDEVYDFGANDFTIQVWVNFNNTDREQTIFEKFSDSNGPGWTLTKLANNSWQFYATPSAVITSPVQTIQAGTWHQVVARRHGGEFQILYDGSSIASVSNLAPIPDTSFPLLVGKRNNADGRNFSVDGRIDEAAIWARALSDTEISTLFNGGLGKTGLKASHFYRITVPGNMVPSQGAQLDLKTLTPAGASGEFRNQFDPALRVYDSLGTLLAADDDSGVDGRNARLGYAIAPATEPQTFYVEVLVSSDPLVGPTKGEYVLDAQVVPNPPPAAILVGKTSLTTSESGAADMFTVCLARQPASAIKVTVVSSDVTEGIVSLSELWFSTSSSVLGGWDVRQEVAVTGHNDDVDDGDKAYTINLTASGGDYGGIINSVSAFNFDDDTAGITVSKTSLVTTENGGSDTFSIKLNSQPVGVVTITIASTNMEEGTVAPLSLTFDGGLDDGAPHGNWSIAQSVTVTGVDDIPAVDDGNVSYAITVTPSSTDGSYNPFPSGKVATVSVPAVNVDNDEDTTHRLRLVDGFEEGNLAKYTENGVTGTSVAVAAGHDGQYGLQDTTNSGWLLRTDTQAQVKRGDIISVWVLSTGATDGRAYFGFGAKTSGKPAGQGCLTMVMAPNTSQLLIQRNVEFRNYETIGAVPQSWQANKWYRMEVEWKTSGQIVGRLYDSDGKTCLNTVTATDTVFSAGGIAFRAFDSTKYFDTVELRKGLLAGAAGGASLTATNSPSAAALADVRVVSARQLDYAALAAVLSAPRAWHPDIVDQAFFDFGTERSRHKGQKRTLDAPYLDLAFQP